MAATGEAAVVDGLATRVQRPRSSANQKVLYDGKRHTHTAQGVAVVPAPALLVGEQDQATGPVEPPARAGTVQPDQRERAQTSGSVGISRASSAASHSASSVRSRPCALSPVLVS
jgi:hypothetical protein